jgi:hypothetical protein
MFFQRYPILIEAGVIDPVVDDLVISNVTYTTATDQYDVVAFDFLLNAAVAGAGISSWFYSQNGASSIFGRVRQPVANAGAVRSLAVPVFGICPDSGGVGAGAKGKVRLIGVTPAAKAAGAGLAQTKGECLCPTGAADTLLKATGALSAKIIAIATGRKSDDSGASADGDVLSQVFFCGFGLGHDG